jgi:hypothetical protein
MTEETPHGVSSSKLWLATLGAIAVAAFLLVAVVLPAEYGIDPTSMGRLVGLTELRPGAQPASGTAESTDELQAIIEGGIVKADPGAQKAYIETFKSEQVTIDLASLEEVEFKAQMNEGDTLLYSWAVELPLYVDLHGEPYNYPEAEVVRYEEADGIASGHGRITAPFSGMHGWYWLNTNDVPVTVKLKVSGFYGSLEEVYRHQQ